MTEERKDYALTITDPAAMMPVIDLRTALERRNQMVQFVKQIMVEGNDFGVIPGTGNKPTLLKPGAEKLTTFFGLTKRFTTLERIEDWDKPFFYYLYRCHLYRGDLLIAEADGSCNSHESKYRYRQAQRICPNCDKPAIIKGKEEYGGGWICYGKKGGCGSKFKDSDPAITGQQLGRVENTDVADQTNTIQKMAQKRALVAATLLAVNASEFFTQDIEDTEDAEYREVPLSEEPGRTPANGKTIQPDNPNRQGAPGTSDERSVTITKPDHLLAYVNDRVEITYDNLSHLYNAVRKVLGEKWTWPGPKDGPRWAEAAAAAIEYANRKQHPANGNGQPGDQAEMPLET